MERTNIMTNSVIENVKTPHLKKSIWQKVFPIIKSVGTLCDYGKRASIYVQDEQSDSIYFVVNGQVKLSYERMNHDIISQHFYSKGEILGELPLFGIYRRRYYASSAAINTQLISISVSRLRLLMTIHPDLNTFIFQKLGQQQLEVENRLADLKSKKSKVRIIEFLVQLAKRQGQRVGYEILVRNFMTHQEIADITSTSRQTVTTELNELRRKNILKYDRRRLLIRDFDKLEKEVAEMSYAYC